MIRYSGVGMQKNYFFILILSFLLLTTACSSFSSSTRDNSQVDKVEESKEAGQFDEKAPVSQATNVNLALAPDIKKIVDRGKLLVGIYSQDMPPFFMKDAQGKLYGYDISIAEDIAKYLNVGVEFDRSASTYQELFENVAQGKVDIVISKFSVTYERAKHVRFTEPYLEMRRALLVNRKDALANGAEGYPIDYLRTNGVKIGVKSKTSYATFAKELFPSAEQVELPEWEDVVDLLVKGEITAAMYDELEIMKLVKKNPDISLFASVYILKDQKDLISMAVPYESTQLLSWLDWFMEYRDIKSDVNKLMNDYAEAFTNNEASEAGE